MSGPVGPETGGRSLADILREAGIENPSRGRRRRWDDADDVGLRQRRADADGQAPVDRPAYGRRAGDLPVDPPAERAERRDERRPESREKSREEGRDRADRRDRRDGTGPVGRRVDTGRPGGGEDRRAPRAAAPAPEPSTAAIQGLRVSQKPEVPPTASVPAVTPTTTTTTGAAAPSPAPAAAPATPATGASTPSATPSASSVRAGRRQRAAAPAEPATGPIPVVRGEDDEQAGTPAGPVAWLRFAGELLLAAAVGVGVYFAFTVLWEMLPHLAVVASPLVVTGLVAGTAAWRQRSGRGPVGTRLLALLVFAGTVLTILPAAGLLAAA